MDSTAKINLIVYRESTGLEILHSINPGEERTLLECLLEASLEIDHSCGGNGTCGTCQVITHPPDEAFSARSEVEKEIALDRGLETHQRLACQMYLLKSAKITIP